MPRIRTIKPEFFTSLTIASLAVEARLTFIGLWTHVDDEGRCVDDTRLVRAALWPLDDRSFADVENDLTELSRASLIRRYEANGKRYLSVSGWGEHQKINRPTPSKLPSPPVDAVTPASSINTTRPGLTEDSVSHHVPRTEDSLAERKGKERKGRDKTFVATEPRPPDSAQAVVGAFIEGALNAGQDRPAGSLPSRVGREAKQLLAEGVPLDKLTAAAEAMGRAGYSDLAKQLHIDAARRTSTNGGRHTPFRDDPNADYHGEL